MRNSLLKLGCGKKPEALEEFIHHLHEAKASVTDHPPAWCPPRQVDPGRGYAPRILENIERTVLLKLLDMLESLMTIESIVFIHDGFLISPEPPAAILQQAQEAILSELDIFDPPQPLFKCVKLSQELAHLEQTHATTPCARVPDLWEVTSTFILENCFYQTTQGSLFPSAVDRQETRLTKRRRSNTGTLKRRMLSAPG